MLPYNNNSITSDSSSTSASISTATSTIKLSLALAFITCFGLALIFTVGFAQGEGNVMHNAAHDTRHAAAFPCH